MLSYLSLNISIWGSGMDSILNQEYFDKLERNYHDHDNLEESEEDDHLVLYGFYKFSEPDEKLIIHRGYLIDIHEIIDQMSEIWEDSQLWRDWRVDRYQKCEYDLIWYWNQNGNYLNMDYLGDDLRYQIYFHKEKDLKHFLELYQAKYVTRYLELFGHEDEDEEISSGMLHG